MKKSSIHIKPENRGKLKSKIGKITEAKLDKAKNSKSSALRKEAVFAENAKKWKH